MLADLRLMQLVSPALPVGGFAYSQGFEAAVEAKLVVDDETAKTWIAGVLLHSLAQLDLRALLLQRQNLAKADFEVFIATDAEIFAYRETSEFRLESEQMARALKRLIIDALPLNPLAERVLQSNCRDWVSMFALASNLLGVSGEKSLVGYAWAWCENQVTAAIKLVPLGQTVGQSLLLELAELIEQLVLEILNDAAAGFGASSPSLAILSSQHEVQYSRMFRS